MKQVTLKSGSRGWQCRLSANYSSLAEFAAYSRTYGLAARLGYTSAAAAWKANPTIQGGINPADFRRA